MSLRYSYLRYQDACIEVKTTSSTKQGSLCFEGSYPRNLCLSVIRCRTVADVLRNLPNVHESYWNYTELTECTQKLPELI